MRAYEMKTAIPDSILEVKDLRKTYHKKGGSAEAVRGISFAVPRGEVYGFLGPNGAGKSTTISTLTTELEPTSGEIWLDGRSVTEDPVSARAEIGVVAQHNNLDRGLTARENLIFHARYFGMSRRNANRKADEYLEKFGLADRQNDYVRSYSGGMAQRLKIARAMMHTPKILFLDKPTTGLDPNYREILWCEMLTLSRESGTTIFLTTHCMEGPEKLAQHMTIVNHGKIVAQGTSSELKALVPTSTIVTLRLAHTEEGFVQKAEELPDVTRARLQNGTLAPYLDRRQPDFDELFRWTESLGTSVLDMNVKETTLDDVFVYLTGKGMNQDA
jgi:ABC-2 type transport system ATP-binding protein